MIKPFDFNIHLVPREDLNLKNQLEANITVEDAITIYNSFRLEAIKFLSGMNIMIFNTSAVYSLNYIEKLYKYLSKDFPGKLAFTQLIPFKKPVKTDYLKKAKLFGLKGIKFHNYVQDISKKNWGDILSWALAAQEEGLFICIDTSYGSNKMYISDNLAMAAWLSEHIKKVPIILLHSGGLRCFEAFLLADSCQNIWLETSFSYNYYENTSIQKFFFEIYKKLSSNRIIYASDYPALGIKDNIKKFSDLLKNYKFNNSSIDKIMFKNASEILNIN